MAAPSARRQCRRRVSTYSILDGGTKKDVRKHIGRLWYLPEVLVTKMASYLEPTVLRLNRELTALARALPERFYERASRALGARHNRYFQSAGVTWKHFHWMVALPLARAVKAGNVTKIESLLFVARPSFFATAPLLLRIALRVARSQKYKVLKSLLRTRTTADCAPLLGAEVVKSTLERDQVLGRNVIRVVAMHAQSFNTIIPRTHLYAAARYAFMGFPSERPQDEPESPTFADVFRLIRGMDALHGRDAYDTSNS